MTDDELLIWSEAVRGYPRSPYYQEIDRLLHWAEYALGNVEYIQGCADESRDAHERHLSQFFRGEVASYRGYYEKSKAELLAFWKCRACDQRGREMVLSSDGQPTTNSGPRRTGGGIGEHDDTGI